MITPSAPADNEQIARRYDAMDAFHQRAFGEHVHHGVYVTGTEPQELAQKNLVVKVAEAAHLRPGLHVVEVGCGYGAAARSFAVDYGCEVVAYTLAQAEADVARARSSRANPRITVGDFLANDLADGSQDAVVAIESAEHFADRQRLFTEACRVLQPGGRLVVASWLSCDRPWAWERSRLLQPICEESRWPVLLDEGEQRRMLWDAGLDVRSIEDLTKQVTKTSLHALSRLGTSVLSHRAEAKAMARTWLAASMRTLRFAVVVAQKPARRATPLK